jgi:hypothetical protein
MARERERAGAESHRLLAPFPFVNFPHVRVCVARVRGNLITAQNQHTSALLVDDDDVCFRWRVMRENHYSLFLSRSLRRIALFRLKRFTNHMREYKMPCVLKVNFNAINKAHIITD